MFKNNNTNQITKILKAVTEGDKEAVSRLYPLIYQELKRLARFHMKREKAGHTLQPTALVHEAFLRLLGNEPVEWNNRAHFFTSAVRAMRRILVDRARKHARLRHGGNWKRVPLVDIEDPASQDRSEQIVALNDALNRLEEIDQRKAHIVQLRYIAGLSVKETAEILDISTTTVKNDWSFARAWLIKEMR